MRRRPRRSSVADPTVFCAPSSLSSVRPEITQNSQVLGHATLALVAGNDVCRQNTYTCAGLAAWSFACHWAVCSHQICFGAEIPKEGPSRRARVARRWTIQARRSATAEASVDSVGGSAGAVASMSTRTVNLTGITWLAAMTRMRPRSAGRVTSRHHRAGPPRYGARGWLCVFAVVGSVLAVAPTAAAQTSSYEDVADDAYFTTPVADLATLGVFAGTECEAGFCPSEAIDRKTMAVWVVRVLDGQDPPPVSESRFDDVDSGSFYAAFIERMAELEVTKGCGDGSGFCPDRNVTRAEMAVFISRAYDLPDGPDPGFSDVPSDAWYAADVGRLAASKITVGCGDGTRFCHGSDTTRGQMATFLWRAKNPDWQSAPNNQLSSGDEQASDDEVTLLLSSDPNGDTFTFRVGRSVDPSTVAQPRGEFSVPVFLCGPSEFFTAQYMTTMVGLLNDNVAEVFNRQSSGIVNVTFEEGSLLSPDLPWHTVHNLFEDPEDNACMNSSRAISNGGYRIVIAWDLGVRNCSGVSLHQPEDAQDSPIFLRVNPFRTIRGDIPLTPEVIYSRLDESARYGVAGSVFGMVPVGSIGSSVPPYGDASLFTSVFEEGTELVAIEDGKLVHRSIADATFVLSCYIREQMGWPVDGNSPPCHRFTPVGSTVSIVPGIQSIVVRWTEPTFTDGVPIAGYTVRLYEDEPTAFERLVGEVPHNASLQPIAQYAAMPHDRSYKFEDLDPSKSYRIEVDLRSGYGRTVVYSNLVRVLASADVIGIGSVGPYGFELSWNPVPGASRYLAGFGDTYFGMEVRTAYLDHHFFGSDQRIYKFDYSYRADDELGSSYWTIDTRYHPQRGLFAQHGAALVDLTSGLVVRSSYELATTTGPTPYYSSALELDGTSVTFDRYNDVQPDTTYTVHIVACGNDSLTSCHDYATVEVTTSPDPAPSPPDEIAVTEVGNTWVDLSWYTVSGIEAYAVCGFYSHCTHPFASSNEVNSRVLKEERVTDLEPETSYAVEVKSCVLAESVGGLPGGLLCGAPVSLSVTTAASQTGIAPGRPDPVTATVGDTWTKLEWDEVPGADEYMVENHGPNVQHPDGYTREARWPTNVDGLPYRQGSLITFRYLLPDTDYTFEIRACLTEGSSRVCSDPLEVSVTTTAVPATRPPPPDPPAGFAVTDVYAADLCVAAQWDPVPGAVEYRLSLNGNPLIRYRPGALEGIPNPRGDYCGLSPDVTYTIGVSVCKTMGASLVCSAHTTRSVTIGSDTP